MNLHATHYQVMFGAAVTAYDSACVPGWTCPRQKGARTIQLYSNTQNGDLLSSFLWHQLQAGRHPGKS